MYSYKEVNLDCAQNNDYEKTAHTQKEISILLGKVYNLMEEKYGIVIPDGITFKFVNKAEIEKDVGKYGGYYSSSTRTIKLIRNKSDNYILSTLFHELTHAWQWQIGNVGNASKIHKEGHSMYVEIECMRELGETAYADRIEKDTETSDDEYGKGLRFWKEYLKEQSDKNIFHHIGNVKEE